jgi:vanillate O-demethylase ferredoxin subunit
MELEVVASTLLANDIRGLTLKSADGTALAPFSAGAHVRLKIKPLMALGTGIDDERCYSLINSTRHDQTYEIAVKLEPQGRGGSRHMHELRPGDRIQASAVKNDFPLAPAAQDSLLIAGGIGITPILSMARALTASGASFQMHYVGRSADSMAFCQDILQTYGAKAHVYHDGGDPAKGIPLHEVLEHPAPGRHVYVCGPKAMIEAICQAARLAGWPSENVHFELFGAPVASQSHEYHVELRRSGLRFTVSPQQSILELMIAKGLDPMFDCKRGECGACAVPVLEGQADHRDYALSEDDRQHMMCVCVSGALSPHLVLDA